MRCRNCDSTWYQDFDPLQGIVEPQCPLCGYPYNQGCRDGYEEAVAKYFAKEFEEIRKGKEE